MPTANEMLSPAKGDGGEHARVRKAEQFATITLTGSEIGTCGACGEERLIFNCHCFTEENRPIVDLCKECAIERAGGEEKVWIRLDRKGLHENWKMNRKDSSKYHGRNVSTGHV